MDDFLTVNQAAIFLKVHPLTIRRYINEGKLKAYKVGGNVRISLNDLRAFTQIFSPSQKQTKNLGSIKTVKEFNFDDPLFIVRGKGLSIEKI